jgi:hypothetical protein
MSVSLNKKVVQQTASHNPTTAVTNRIPNMVRESNRIAHYWGELTPRFKLFKRSGVYQKFSILATSALRRKHTCSVCKTLTLSLGKNLQILDGSPTAPEDHSSKSVEPTSRER